MHDRTERSKVAGSTEYESIPRRVVKTEE